MVDQRTNAQTPATEQLASGDGSNWDSLRILCLVCTYNEVENIRILIDRIQAVLPKADILVVDDNSPDGTGSTVSDRSNRDERVRVIIRDGKLGLGTAIRLGLQYAIAHDFDIVVNLDADLSHEPETIPSLLNALLVTPTFDLAIGSRYVSGGQIEGLSQARRWMSRAVNFYARLLLGLRVGDWSSAFRAYRVATLNKIDWESLICPGYGALQELLWAVHSAGGRITERPITYVNRKFGKSKISMKDAKGALATIHRLAYRRFFSR